MRRIDKRTEPLELAEWKSRHRSDPNYGYSLLRKDAVAIHAVERALVEEQGNLCAYTGQRIGDRGNPADFHVEHLTAQAHCTRGQDVDYRNLVACQPGPDDVRSDHGAHPKGSWPGPDEAFLFVSPVDASCEGRFRFDNLGEIHAANPEDQAASTTIKRLRLDSRRLNALRLGAIDETLHQALRGEDARRELKRLETAEQQLASGSRIRLRPYCFALKQALQRYVSHCERIVRNRPRRS